MGGKGDAKERLKNVGPIRKKKYHLPGEKAVHL